MWRQVWLKPGAAKPSWRPLLGPTLLFVKPRPSSRQPVILGSRALTLRPPAPTTDRSSDRGENLPRPRARALPTVKEKTRAARTRKP